MSTTSSAAQVKEHKHFSSSILLWVRTDQPRQVGMDYWKGPHSGIIAASPGLEEYRQIHLDETNPGRWPCAAGVETEIPVDRKVDGVAEVTFQSVLSPLKGRKQTQLAYKDESNVFRRTLLYAGPPSSSRWYEALHRRGCRAGRRAGRGSDDLVAMATFPLTRPGENTVPVRMQTEHLAAVEKDLEQRGVPADIVEKCFLGLHRCDELPLEVWIGMITDAYNLATAIAAAPSYDAVRGQVQAERRM